MILGIYRIYKHHSKILLYYINKDNDHYSISPISILCKVSILKHTLKNYTRIINSNISTKENFVINSSCDILKIFSFSSDFNILKVL